jgi:hypothetical protein
MLLYIFDVRNLASPKPQRRNIHETIRDDNSLDVCAFDLGFGRVDTDSWRPRSATARIAR